MEGNLILARYDFQLPPTLLGKKILQPGKFTPFGCGRGKFYPGALLSGVIVP